MLRSDERFFFGSFQPLQVPLAAERLVPVFIGFIIYELYREARAGVLGAPLFVASRSLRSVVQPQYSVPSAQRSR